MPSIAKLTTTFLLAVSSASASFPSALNKRAGPDIGTVVSTCTEPNTIALTFDDGPYNYTEKILSDLEAAGAKATFFVTGTLYDCIYNRVDTLKAIYDAGHQIASHTWSHEDLTNLPNSTVMFQVTKLDAAFANILDMRPTYLRPPYGSFGGDVLPLMEYLEYRLVTWDIDTQDWNDVPVSESKAAFEEADPDESHIALMHEPIQSTAEELVPWVLEWAASKNLSMVTVAECLGDAGGEYTSPALKGEPWYC